MGGDREFVFVVVEGNGGGKMREEGIRLFDVVVVVVVVVKSWCLLSEFRTSRRGNGE